MTSSTPCDSLERADGAGHFEQVIGWAVHCLVEDYWDRCDGEILTGCREGLRPLSWGRREQEASDYRHQAYAVTMPKTPLGFYLSTDASSTPRGFYPWASGIPMRRRRWPPHRSRPVDGWSEAQEAS